MPVFEHNLPSLKKGNTVVPARDVLHLAGACVNIVIAHPNPDNSASHSGVALIDTGAIRTAIDERICKKLNLTPSAQVQMSHAGGTAMRTCYAAQISFPQLLPRPISMPRTLSVDLSGNKLPIIALVGRDILAHMKFVYNGPRGRIEIAY